MAENRSIARDIVVGLVTSAIGFGGAWYLQERSHTAELAAQKQAAAEAAERQQAAIAAEADSQRALRAEQNTLALYGHWLSPDVAARRALATALIGPPGATYAKIMADPAVSQDRKDALNETLAFFAQARSLAEAGELDTPKARGLFGPPAAWWSKTGLPALIGDWTVERNGPLPGEIVNAAYGLAVLGGDLQAKAPPLDLQQLAYYVGLGPSGGRSGIGAFAPTTSFAARPARPNILRAPPFILLPGRPPPPPPH